MIRTDATVRIKREAYRLGFDLCGFTHRLKPRHPTYFNEWLAEKRYAGMEWIAKHAELRQDPSLILEGTRSAIVLGTSYAHEGIEHDYSLARYAHGDDYHAWMRENVNALCDFIAREIAPGFAHKSFVDTGPVLERDLAAQAGLGWIGKNTCLINRDIGSYVFLAVVLCDLDLPQDAPAPDACLECRLCLDACPTDALSEYRLDPAKCLAYHNIEKRGAREPAYWEALGDNVVGCDICQEVCPWNVTTPETRQKKWLATFPATDLGGLKEILRLDERSYRSKTKRSAVSRIKYEDFMRNVFLAIANFQRHELLEDVREWGAQNPGLALAEWEHCVEKLSKG